MITEKRYIGEDRDNYLVLKQDGNIVTIMLKIKGDTKIRKIGTIDKAQRVLYINRKRNAHLFMKTNSYGFNDYVMRTGTTFDKVHISDEHDSWIIPVMDILNKGRKYLHFKQQGFELQLFLSLEEMEQYKANQIVHI